MKKNNKGFMLVEVIIVTVVVVTIMTSLYVAFNKVYTAYEEKNNYTNIDGIYALKLIKDDLIDNMKINSFISDEVDVNGYKEISNETDDYIKSIFLEYKINKVYLVDSASIDNLKNIKVDIDGVEEDAISKTFKDYIDYLTTKEITNNSEYLLLLEITIDSENEIYNYAYLET